MQIKETIKNNKIKPKYYRNILRSFIIGGIIAIIGQGLIYFYFSVCNLDKKLSQTLMSVTLILVASILTGMGIYDKLGQYAGCGTIIPITGFANSMTSSAMESRSEGVFLGIASNLFKLAGSVITFGVVSAAVFGLIRYFLEVM